jgi:hypothetical protein
MVGFPEDWYEIKPANYKILQADNTSVFLIDFNIPKTAETGEYTVTLNAVSGTVSDQKVVHISVLESIGELLRIEIITLKDDLQSTTTDAMVAQSEGKDTAVVWVLLNETKIQISLAEENLRKLNTDGTLENIGNAKNLLEKAKDILNKLEIVKVESVFPLMQVMYIFLPSTGGAAALLLFLRKKKKLPDLGRVIPLKKIIEGMRSKVPAKDELLKEREKISRMMEVLENEKKEQLVSDKAYEEMKKTIKEKKDKLDKKLSRYKA